MSSSNVSSPLIQNVENVLLNAFLVKTCRFKTAFFLKLFNEKCKFVSACVILSKCWNDISWPCSDNGFSNSFSSTKKWYSI